MIDVSDTEAVLPVILRRHAVRESSLEEGGLDTTLAKVKTGLFVRDWVKRVITRPIRMFAEPMVLFTDLYLLYQHSILFLPFEAYPIIFKGI